MDIHISCGIDYGKILVIKGEDCFGDAVNRASKLGEDVASSGEVLITSEAMALIPPGAGFQAAEKNITISGITIAAWSVVVDR